MKNSRQTHAYRELRKKILEGVYVQGEFLPSLRILAPEFSTSVTPVYKAVQQLAREGFLEIVHGSGIRLLARSVEEMHAARKPMIQYLGVAANYHGDEQPRERFTVISTSDWLLWELTHSTEISASVAHFPIGDQAAFVARLKDAVYSDAQVIVFASPETPDEMALEVMQRMREGGKFVVYEGCSQELPGYDCVRGDFREGSRLLTRYLLERGHRHILRLHGSLSLWYEQQKQQGFETAISTWNESGAKPAHGFLRLAAAADDEPSYEEEIARNVKIIQDALSQTPITAIMAVNDAATLCLRVALERLGKEKIEVTGYDANWHEIRQHRNLAQHYGIEVNLPNPKASVDASFRQLGIELAHLAIARATGQLPPVPQIVTVPHHLVLSRDPVGTTK